MSSFKGTYSHSVDEKGRLNLPSKLRKYVAAENNDVYVVTRGFDQCLFVYPLDEWMKVEEKLRALNPYNPEHRNFLRRISEMANEAQLDSQGRLYLPQDLRDYAKIRGEVRIIGVQERIELWAPEMYRKWDEAQEEPYDKIAERVMK